jgi:hypothetical protein
MPTTLPVRVSALAAVASRTSTAEVRSRVELVLIVEGLFFMADLSRFQQYYKLADMLIERSSKEQLAECARLLALNLAHYQGLYGEVPLSDTLTMVSAPGPNDGQAALLVDGMEILVGVLGNVVSGLGEEKH